MTESWEKNQTDFALSFSECRGGAQKIMQQVTNSRTHFKQGRLAGLSDAWAMLKILNGDHRMDPAMLELQAMIAREEKNV